MRWTVGSLFSGIGGLDLGLERAGMNVIWQSEIDPYACKVLSKHWPEVVNHGDIKKINWASVERPDVICGGYPCQPFSQAGKRKGADDPRHLWPWVREAISELRPRYAILENVRGHVTLGLSTVLGDLAAVGYDAEWNIVSAASVGANHRRERVIIVAYPKSKYSNSGNNNSRVSARPQAVPQLGDGGWTQTVADANDARPHREEVNTAEIGLNAQRRIRGRGQDVANTDGRRRSERNKTIGSVPISNKVSSDVANADGSEPTNGRQREAVSGKDTGRRNDGTRSGSDTGQVSLEGARQSSGAMANADTWQTSWWLRSSEQNTRFVFSQQNRQRGTQGYAGWQWWQTEPNVGRVVDGVSSRVDRLKGLGNAVVPQVAEVIGRLVINAHNE